MRSCFSRSITRPRYLACHCSRTKRAVPVPAAGSGAAIRNLVGIVGFGEGDRLSVGSRTPSDATFLSTANAGRGRGARNRGSSTADAPVTSRIPPTTCRKATLTSTRATGSRTARNCPRGVPFRRRHRLYGAFVLYAGRVQPNNGCEELLEYFDACASGNGTTTLVLMGAKLMKVPEQPHLRMWGCSARARADDCLRGGRCDRRAGAGRSGCDRGARKFCCGHAGARQQGMRPRQTIAAEQMLACTPRATSSSRLCDC